jgi:hypothetical protein
VVLDAQRILADQIVCELVDHLLGGLEKAPGADLAQSNDSFVRVDLKEEIPIYWDRGYSRNAHNAKLIGIAFS